MKNDFDDFGEIMKNKTDEELLVIISADRDKYMAKALIAAESEILRRKISRTSVNEALLKAEEDVLFINEIESEIESLRASWGKRMINVTVDILIIFLADFLLFRTLESMEFLIFYYYPYAIFFEWKYQQTVGKMFTKTKVVTLRGRKPSLIKCFIRAFFRFFPAWIIPGCNYYDDFVHDNISRTAVINKVK